MIPLRIVLLLLDAPLPFGRAPGRGSSVLLKGLVERGHRVTAFAVCATPEEAERARAEFPAPQYDLRCYAMHDDRRGLAAKLDTIRRPYGYVIRPELQSDLDAELAKGFDVLHQDLLWAGWAGLAHARKAFVVAHYLFEIDLALRAGEGLRERFRKWITYRAERRLLRSYPRVVTLSERISARVREIAPGSEVVTIPLAIDPSLYRFEPGRRGEGPPTVGLIGTFGWEPNRQAGVRLMERLWPEIHRRRPEARLRVAGPRSTEVLAPYRDLPGVSIEGFVPDPEDFFRGLDVLLYAPGQASGMKVKVMESFAYGTPVVTNSQGAEGLAVEDGVHAGLAEDDAGLVERAVALLDDRARGARQAEMARGLLESTCGPAPYLDAVERLYARIVAG